jgi:hypothetical protein
VNRISSLPALAIFAVADIAAASRHSRKQQNSSKVHIQINRQAVLCQYFYVKSSSAIHRACYENRHSSNMTNSFGKILFLTGMDHSLQKENIKRILREY